MRISRPQKALADIIRGVFGYNSVKDNYRGFDWLRTDLGRKQEIDIWVPSLKLAIEYDGEQHFYPVKFGGIDDEEAKDRFRRTVELDLMKTASIKRSKEVKYFIRFNYKDGLSKCFVIESLKQMRIEIPTMWFENTDDWLDLCLNPSPTIDFVDYESIS